MTEGTVIRAAGALLWRGEPESPLIALIHRPRYDDWSIPKGKLDAGESAPVAAVREVLEETGIPVTLGRPLPSQHYTSRDRPKQVDFWVSHVDAPGPFRANDEVDALEWLAPDAALERLSYHRDSALIEAFAADPVVTTPLTLLRHAHALSRSDWVGDDLDRPLAPEGSAAAERAATVLRCRGGGAVVSSPARRCLDTLGPLVRWDFSAVDVHEWLAEEVFDDPAAGVRVLLSLAASGPTVVCGHRPVLTELAVQFGVARDDAALQPAGGWILHVAQGNGAPRVVAAEKFATP